MLKNLFFFISAGLIAFGQDTGKARLLTPRADSPTAMRRCGAELESVKAKHELFRRYVFTGEEILTGMQYCVEGRHSLTDDKHTYRVPAGTIGWLAVDDLEVVLEECVNMAHCDWCFPDFPASTILEEPPPTPAPMPVVELLTYEPAEPAVQLNELPPALERPVAPIPIAFVPDKEHKFPIPCWPREKGWYGTGIPILSCVAIAAGIGLPFIGGHAATAVAVGSKVVPPGGVISPSWVALLGI
jgi:hypothetical protein